MPEEPTDSSYHIGYGKPPRESRFMPGKSGNPKGRPKGRETFPAKIRKALAKKVTVNVNRESKRMSVEDAVIMSLFQVLLHGPPDKKIAILKFVQPFLDDEESEPEELCLANLSDDELDELERLYVKADSESI